MVEVEEGRYGFKFVCEDYDDVELVRDSLRQACDLFKRGDEIDITRDGDTLHIVGPWDEMLLLWEGFVYHDDNEEASYG